MKQSKELTAFYKAWLEWAENGAVSAGFESCWGLCANLEYYLYVNDNYQGNAYDEMINQFSDAGLDRCYPFGGEAKYDIKLHNSSMHLCTMRIQWVKDHIPA